MSHDINKKGFLERIPSFSLILIMVVLTVGRCRFNTDAANHLSSFSRTGEEADYQL